MKTKSEIFTASWNAARKAAVRFGGTARDFFADALRTAYAILRKKIAAVAVLSPAEKVSRLMGLTMSWSRDARKGFAWRFIGENAERVARYGEKTIFSAKQIEVINDLYAKHA